jgi:Periplasmic binding protein
VLRSRRVSAAVVALIIGLAACGNSGEDEASPSTTANDDGGSAEAGGGEGQRDEFVSLSGVPGVTDEEISFAAIGTKSGNPLGTCILDCYVQGIEAYFAYRNSEGGIYGRDLVLQEPLDDELSQNQARSLDVISDNSSFGAFQATLLATGWGDLDSAGVPTYTWGIHAAEAASRPHIFPSQPGLRCDQCTARAVPYAAQISGAQHAATLGYGATENSRVCAQTTADSIELYEDDTGVDVAYTNDNLAFGLPNGIGPEVTAMKDAGVDFVSTCIDLNGMKTLAQELQRQGMDDVVLYHPNTYNQQFVSEAGDLFEGDIVAVQFRPFEATSEGTALGDFQEWMDRQGDEPTELAMVGWINASLAFEGLLAAGPEFDREAVTAATNAMTTFDAGGILEPVNWSEAHSPYTQETRDQDSGGECTSLVKVEGGEFTTVAPPDTPWLCWSQTDLAWSEPEFTGFD